MSSRGRGVRSWRFLRGALGGSDQGRRSIADSFFPGHDIYYHSGPSSLDGFDVKKKAVYTYLRRRMCVWDGHLSEEEADLQYFDVSIDEVLGNIDFNSAWPNFMEELSLFPQEIVTLWGCVMHKIVYEEWIHLLGIPPDIPIAEGNASNMLKGIGKIHVGIFVTNPITPLTSLTAETLGKLVVISGQVVGMGSIRPICLKMPFTCGVCKGIFQVDQPNGVYTPPSNCGVNELCDSHIFQMSEEDPSIVMAESRRIKLRDVLGSGSLSSVIKCELFDTLVNCCGTGDVVTITGIPRVEREPTAFKPDNMYNLVVQVIAIRNHKDAERTLGGNAFLFKDEDFIIIREIYDKPNLFKLLVASLCPSIYGHEYVKASLLLSLLGGTPQSGEEVIASRSDINMLMIGDPGMGKSQMLKVVSDVAPKGIYVCGTGVSKVGLTVALVREGGDFSVEAGALVLADQGICCIDEFDKMPSHHLALLEAMEQQTVSIAKSGVFRTLSARTTVIAAANPVDGHYDKAKSVSDNIKIGTPLLSRFDIVFILFDTPDKQKDRLIMEHILGPNATLPSTSATFEPLENSLLEELMVKRGEDIQVIPRQLLRKYIAYAKQYVFPKLTPQASNVLKKYYLKMRKRHHSMDSPPMTARQLESFVRLTQARAKAELRDIASEKDAKDILQLYESSLLNVFEEEDTQSTPLSHGSRRATPRTDGRSRQIRDLLAALQIKARQDSNRIFTTGEIKNVITGLGLTVPPDDCITYLNDGCHLLMKGRGVYQLETI